MHPERGHAEATACAQPRACSELAAEQGSVQATRGAFRSFARLVGSLLSRQRTSPTPFLLRDDAHGSL